MRPVLLYDTFEDFCRDNGGDRKRPFPCLFCGGQGWVRVENGYYYDIYDEDDDDEDCYSVLQSLSKVVCQCRRCHGSGNGTEEACRKAYAKVLKTFERDTKRYEAFLALVERAKAKVKNGKRLTKGERQALKRIGA